jgi:[histone H4]-N-methyl-L-lysine20 N-methyltransferase
VRKEKARASTNKGKNMTVLGMLLYRSCSAIFLQVISCMRHYAIYNVPWPNRIPTNGGAAFVPTPRPESITPADMTTSSRHISKHAAIKDRSVSLSSSVLFKAKPKPRQDEEGDERPSKKRKPDPVPRERPHMYARARAVLGVGKSRSGRARVPSRKVQDSVIRGPRATDGLKNTGQDESTTASNMDKTPVQLQRARQKFTFRAGASMREVIVRQSRAERATARTRIKAKLEKEAKEKSMQTDQNVVAGDVEDDDEEGINGIPRKRSRDSETNETHERPCRRLRPTEGDDDVPRRLGMQRLRYNGASNLLSHAPNPLLFARRKWIATLPEHESELASGDNFLPWQGSTDESDGPVTPEDDDLTIPDEECQASSPNHVPRAKPFVGRGMKPSPVNFARKRWSSLSNEPNIGSATISNPSDSFSEASTPPSVDSNFTDDLFQADDSHGQNTKSPLHYSKLDTPSTYLPSRIWQVNHLVEPLPVCDIV